MKVCWLLAGCICLLVVTSCVGAPPGPIEVSPEAEKLLEELLQIAEEEHHDEDSERTRRLSHFDKHKFDKFSLGSISSFHHDHDKYPIEYGHKSFNLWGFKKAILASLLQAIKAITGGVIALKGHLIKVNGHFVQAKGKFLEHKGEAIKDFGKHVVHKALTKPIHVDFTAPGHGGSHHSGGHHGGGYPSGHGGSYGPPSGHGGSYPPSSYGPPPTSFGPYPIPMEHHHYYHQHQQPSYDYSAKKDETNKGLPDGLQAGLIVLKPIKGGHDDSGQIYDHSGAYTEPRPFSIQSSISRSIEYPPLEYQDYQHGQYK